MAFNALPIVADHAMLAVVVPMVGWTRKRRGHNAWPPRRYLWPVITVLIGFEMIAFGAALGGNAGTSLFWVGVGIGIVGLVLIRQLAGADRAKAKPKS